MLQCSTSEAGVSALYLRSLHLCNRTTGKKKALHLCPLSLIEIRNVGPFRYWTLSNLPLFTLAGPVLYLMTSNSTSVIASYWTQRSDKHSLPQSSGVDSGTAVRLALPELLLPLLALTTYHVQIITRISSGYPLWYVGLAATMVGNAQPRSKTLVRFMVLYAAIQAALYTSFLPPA